MRRVRVNSVRDELEIRSKLSEDSRRECDRRHDESRIRFEEFIKRFDRSEANWKEERRGMEARLAADRKEATEKHAASLAEFRQERIETKQEFTAQRRWLMANFATILVGMVSIFAAIVMLMT